MPRLNSRGQAVCGVADGIVSIDRQEVGRGGAACWLDDDRVVFQRNAGGGMWHVAAYDQRTGRTDVLAHRDANFVCGGGGHWAAHGSSGIFGSRPFPPEATLALASTDNRGATGPDGTIATTDPSGLGFVLHAPDWRRTVGAPGQPAYNLTVLSATQAIWTHDGHFRTLNLPPPFPLGVVGRACWCVVDGRVWLVHYLAGVGLVVREHGSSMGQVIETAGIYFHYDAIAWQHGVRVAYSSSTGEAPHELIVRPLDITRGLIDLAALLERPKPDEPKPVTKPDDPKPEPPPMKVIPPDTQAAILDRLRELTREYPEAWADCHRYIDLFGRSTGISHERARLFNWIAVWDLSRRWPPIGMNGKRGNPNDLSMDAFAWRHSDDRRDVSIIDFVVNAGISEAYAAQLARGEGIPSLAEIRANPDWQKFVDEVERTGGIRHPSASIEWTDQTEISRPHGGGIWVEPHRPVEYRGDVVIDPVKPPPPPVDQPARPELAPMVAQLRQTIASLMALPPPPPPPVQECPPCPLPHDARPAHPSYDEMMAMQRAAGVDEFTAHLVWRFLLEGYTVEQLVEEARGR